MHASVALFWLRYRSVIPTVASARAAVRELLLQLLAEKLEASKPLHPGDYFPDESVLADYLAQTKIRALRTASIG